MTIQLKGNFPLSTAAHDDIVKLIAFASEHLDVPLKVTQWGNIKENDPDLVRLNNEINESVIQKIIEERS